MTTAAAPAASAATERLELIVFRLDERDYALPVADVQEILRMVAVAPVPEAPHFVLGVMNLRGRVVPVVDLRRRLGFEPVALRLDTPIIVAQVNGRAVGLVADAVSDLLDVDPADIEPAGSVASLDHPVNRIARAGDQLILLFDLPLLDVGMDVG